MSFHFSIWGPKQWDPERKLEVNHFLFSRRIKWRRQGKRLPWPFSSSGSVQENPVDWSAWASNSWWLPEKKNLIIVCLENEVANSMWQLQSWFFFSKGSLNYSYALRISHHSYQLDDDSKQKLDFPLMDDLLTSQIQRFDFIGVERFMNSFRFILMY